MNHLEWCLPYSKCSINISCHCCYHHHHHEVCSFLFFKEEQINFKESFPVGAHSPFPISSQLRYHILNAQTLEMMQDYVHLKILHILLKFPKSQYFYFRLQFINFLFHPADKSFNCQDKPYFFCLSIHCTFSISLRCYQTLQDLLSCSLTLFFHWLLQFLSAFQPPSLLPWS